MELLLLNKDIDRIEVGARTGACMFEMDILNTHYPAVNLKKVKLDQPTEGPTNAVTYTRMKMRPIDGR